MDILLKSIRNFSIRDYLNKYLVNTFGLYGIYKLFKKILWPPIFGFLSHVLRPRKNLKAKYECGWVMVTGASDGIGEALCHELAKCGFNLVLIGRTLSKLEKVSKDL